MKEQANKTKYNKNTKLVRYEHTQNKIQIVKAVQEAPGEPNV